MNRSHYLIASVFLCALILAAGCTQNSGTVTPVTQVTPAASSISSLSLTASDVPEGFVLKDARTKQPDEMTALAINLGWQGGYTAHFVKPSDNPVNSSEILQSIAMYPAQNITGILSYAEKGDQSDMDFTYTKLPSPALGDFSDAFQAKSNAQFIVKPDNSNPLLTGKAEAVMKPGFVEIVFSKGNIFEVFRWTGPDADFTALKGMAEAAYKKIP